ncbi:MAG: phosphatidylinositol-binding protein scs2 [Pycnora praestabilis]|nr:MAG: phosphatidylinositol-binding protein scs2 [Pycnora praestabilis]
MSIEIDPAELGFRRPFTHEVTQVLRLRNPNSDPLAFKVKTTAPKQYCVRPNSGRIESGKEVEVQVLLQAMKEDPPLDARCRDKFLVQSVAVTAEKEFSNVASIWQHVEKTSKASILERKIRVVFLPADGGAAVGTPTHNNVNGNHFDHDTPHADPPAYQSPSPEAVTPQSRSVTGGPVGAVSVPESRPADNRHLGDARESAYNPAMSSQQSTISSAASGIANAIPTSGEDFKAQLTDAKATISKLRQQAEEQGLRQRKSDAVNQDSRERITTGTTGMGVQQQPANGVPVQIVAGLCLLSFLLAYFFF